MYGPSEVRRLTLRLILAFGAIPILVRERIAYAELLTAHGGSGRMDLASSFGDGRGESR